jgi:hypothetical protein
MICDTHRRLRVVVTHGGLVDRCYNLLCLFDIAGPEPCRLFERPSLLFEAAERITMANYFR